MESSEKRPIDLLADNILNTQFADIDPVTIEQAKLRIIDTIGCLIGGANDQGNSELVKLILDRGGTPEATILMYGARVPVGFAAMVNCILCRSFDYEPVSPVVDGKMTSAHISGTNVMTALSLAEFKKVSGKELLTAMLVGDDMTARVLATSGFDINLGWDGNGSANLLGASAIAGRMLALNADELKNAFGLSLSQMAGTMQNIWDGTPAFKLPQGLSAENAVFSAQLAKAGWTGPEDALFSPNGYFALYTNGARNKDVLTKDLGRIYYADRAIKPYPGCRATHAPISAAISLTKKHPVQVENIQEVLVTMPEGGVKNFCGKPLRLGKFPHADTMFSYQYTIATALRNGAVTPHHYMPEVLQDKEIISFAKSIKLQAADIDQPIGIGIAIQMKDGSTVRDFWTDDNKGDFIDNPLSDEAFYDKYKGNIEVSGLMSIEKADRIFEKIQKLEEIEDITEVITLLVQ